MLVCKHIKRNFLYIVIIVVNSCPALFISVSIKPIQTNPNHVHQFSTDPIRRSDDNLICAFKCKRVYRIKKFEIQKHDVEK